MTVRYRCRRPDDAALRQRLPALTHERRRFGYRRLHVLLRREGFARELDRQLVACNEPKTVVSDNGTELTSYAILRSAVG
jgi:putative transposase